MFVKILKIQDGGRNCIKIYVTNASAIQSIAWTGFLRLQVQPSGWYTCYYYWLTLLLLRHRFRPGASDNRVVVGMHNLRQPDSFTQTIRVTEIIPMAKYGRPPRQNSNDIMLLKLETAITFNDAVSPVCLPTQFKPIASGRRCYSTGWGALRGQISHSNSYRAHASAVSCWRG